MFYHVEQDFIRCFQLLNLVRWGFFFWNYLMGAWRNVRDNLVKAKPTILDEILCQPFFGNIHILHLVSKNLILVAQVGKTMAFVGCTRVKDLWDATSCNWKELKDLGLRRTSTSVVACNNLMINMPWGPCTTSSMFIQRDWVGLIQHTQLNGYIWC